MILRYAIKRRSFTHYQVLNPYQKYFFFDLKVRRYGCIAFFSQNKIDYPETGNSTGLEKLRWLQIKECKK